jgi:hypothetical protein
MGLARGSAYARDSAGAARGLIIDVFLDAFR